MSNISRKEINITDEELNRLKPFQLKYIQYACAGMYSDLEIRKMLKISSAKFKRFCTEDDVVFRLLSKSKRELLVESLEDQAVQRRLLNKKLFSTAMSVFDDIDEDDLPADPARRKMALQTKAKNLSADKAIKLYLDFIKVNATLDTGAKESDDELVERIRLQADKRRTRDKNLTEELGKFEIGYEQLYDMIEFDQHGNIVPTELNKQLVSVKSDNEVEADSFDAAYDRIKDATNKE